MPPSKQTVEMAAEQKEEVSSLNLNLSLHACSSLSVPVCRLARDHGVQFNLYHLPPLITHLQKVWVDRLYGGFARGHGSAFLLNFFRLQRVVSGLILWPIQTNTRTYITYLGRKIGGRTVVWNIDMSYIEQKTKWKSD